MIKVTNNTKDFIEKQCGEIFIYGAGNAGYWVGNYMNRCGVDFSAYFDKKINHEEATYNGKPVISIERLKEYKGRSIRIIVTPKCYENVLADLLWLDHLYEFHALCLIPRFKHLSTHEEGYHINKLLSYFRGLLFVGTTPTILCNSCIGGQIYDAIDRTLLTPTVNVGIEPRDFLRLCKKPNHYLSIDAEELHWVRSFGNPGREYDDLCTRIDDIEVIFAHTDSSEGVLERWNYMRKKVNWDRVIFLLTEQPTQDNIPFDVLNTFFSLKGEKLFINNHSFISGGADYESVYIPNAEWITGRDSAIENYFDLLGWMNGDYKKYVG